MRNLKAWDVWAVFAIAVVAVILAVVFNQSPLLVFTLVAFALCAYVAIRDLLTVGLSLEPAKGEESATAKRTAISVL